VVIGAGITIYTEDIKNTEKNNLTFLKLLAVIIIGLIIGAVLKSKTRIRS